MAGYKKELAKVMGRIERLESQQQLAQPERGELQRLQQKEQSLLDLIKELQQEKNLRLQSSGESFASSVRRS
jgi:hypothetical protein